MSICKHDWELKPVNGKWLLVCKYYNQVLAYTQVGITMSDE